MERWGQNNCETFKIRSISAYAAERDEINNQIEITLRSQQCSDLQVDSEKYGE